MEGEYGHNPHYAGALAREKQLDTWKSQNKTAVPASSQETMRRMQNRNNTPLGPTVTIPVSMGNAMNQKMIADRVRANQARLQYRRDRVNYLLGR